MDAAKLLEELKIQFLHDFEERITSIQNSLLNLGNDFSGTLDSVLRELHTIKGDANAVGYLTLSQGIHQCEEQLLPFRHHRPLDPSLSSLFEIAISDLSYELQSYRDQLKVSPDPEDQKSPIGKSLAVIQPQLLSKFEPVTSEERPSHTEDAGWTVPQAEAITPPEPLQPKAEPVSKVTPAVPKQDMSSEASAPPKAETLSQTCLFAEVSSIPILLPIEHVESVQEYSEFTRLPSTSELSPGVLESHGRTVPVFDLPRAMNCSSEARLYFVILIKEGRRLAVPVSQASRVATITSEPHCHKALEGSRLAKSLFIEGTDSLLLLDIDSIFSIAQDAA